MANRRCIDRAIVGSLRFLEMGKSAQALYMHIVINSDDDGCSEAGQLLRTTNTRKTALQELIDNGFVTVIDQQKNIVYTNDWHSFNHVDARYGRDSYYRETLKAHFPSIELEDFQGKKTSKHASGTRISKVKSREEKRNQVKLSEEPSSDGMDSDNQQTDNNISFHEQYPYDFTDATIPPSSQMIESFFKERIFYDDEWFGGRKATEQAKKFCDLNERNAWHFVQMNGLLATLEQFIRHDATMARKYDEWQPSEDFLNERKVVELISSPEFEELSEKYYVLANTEYGCSSQEQIAEWLLDNYDGLSPRGRYRLDDDFRKAEEESDDGTDEDNQYQYDEPDTESELYMRFRSAAQDVWTYVQHHDESMTDEKVLEWWHKARNKYNSIETVILNFEQNVKRVRGEESLPFA